jgi:hypothetical protein
MKEPYIEGLASHDGPESCVYGGNPLREALTGVRVGRVLSSEKLRSRVPTPSQGAEGHVLRGVFACLEVTLRSLRPLACAETPCARTGRSTSCPHWMAVGVASGRPKVMSR